MALGIAYCDIRYYNILCYVIILYYDIIRSIIQ